MLALNSFWYLRDPSWVHAMNDAGIQIMIDSGAFTWHGKKESKDEDVMDRDEFFDEYVRFLREVEGSVEAYFNLDTEADQGDANYMESQLRKEGLKPIPVWHGDGKDWTGFEDWLTRYDHKYVSIGSNNTASHVTATPHYGLKRLAAFTRRVKRLSPGTKIHILGESSERVLKQIGPYSSDSIETTSYYRHPGAKLKIFSRRTRKWYEMEREPERWSNMDAVKALLDIVNEPSLEAVQAKLDTYDRYQTSMQEVAIFAGWYNWSQMLRDKDLCRVYAALNIKHKLANIGLVGWMAGWLDKSFVDWLQALPTAAEMRAAKKAGKEKAEAEKANESD